MSCDIKELEKKDKVFKKEKDSLYNNMPVDGDIK